MCLATLDQYLATCSHRRYQQLSNIQIAHRLSLVMILFWILHAIPCMFYFNLIEQSTSHQIVCVSINSTFQIYHAYVYIISLSRVIPVTMTILFGSLAYRNTQQLTHRTLPLVRRQLDKQLTIMVLVKVIHNFFVTIPYIIVIGIIDTGC